MIIAIVTNNEPHHRYFITELYKSFNVSLMFHPTGSKKQNIFMKHNNYDKS